MTKPLFDSICLALIAVCCLYAAFHGWGTAG